MTKSKGNDYVSCLIKCKYSSRANEQELRVSNWLQCFPSNGNKPSEVWDVENMLIKPILLVISYFQ